MAGQPASSQFSHSLQKSYTRRRCRRRPQPGGAVRRTGRGDQPGGRARPVPPCPGLPFFVKLKRCTSGRDLLIRSALPGTDRILISPCSPRWPSGWICTCSTAGIAARRGLSSPRWMASSGTATCRVSARASNTATGCTARTRRAAASGATRRSCCSTRTARPSKASSAGTRPLFSDRSGAPDAINTRDSAPFMPRNVVINPYFDGGDDRPPRTPYHETVT